MFTKVTLIVACWDQHMLTYENADNATLVQSIYEAKAKIER